MTRNQPAPSGLQGADDPAPAPDLSPDLAPGRSSDLARELALARRFGDRTNSLTTLFPWFSSFFPEGSEAVVRFLRAGSALVAAGEPLARPGERAEALDRFRQAHPGRRVLVMPVGQTLARELAGRGFTVWQAGSEPVFDLPEFFATLKDPLLMHPVARTLKRRGAEVREVPWAELSADRGRDGLRAVLEDLARRWRAERSGPPLGFLSAALPFHLGELRRFFVLEVRGEVQAFASALPLFREGEVQGWYLADILRHPEAKAGANDLLVCEAMALLRREGVREVRLGMCALARIEPDAPGAGLLRVLFRRWRLGYNFASLHEFKDKFMPTRWEPLFLASTCSSLVPALATAVRAHVQGGPARGLARTLGERAVRPWRRLLDLRPEALARLGVDNGLELMPRSLPDFLRRTRHTTALMLLFLALHALRLASPRVADLFGRSAYVAGAVTWEGLLLGPFFHNHWFHLVGDQMTFYATGCLVELTLGPWAFWAITAGGLWLSNPLTHGLYALFLERLSPAAWAFLLQERDYGSSNAAFALVGAYCGLLARKAWLLVPFVASGVTICLAKESWLALHHLLTLAGGLWGMQAWLAFTAPRGPGR